MERMKNYIGVKIVKAKPGTMAEAQAMKTKIPLEDCERLLKKNGKTSEMGYIVSYPDGYISWSPKEAFEKAYRELDCEDFIFSRH